MRLSTKIQTLALDYAEKFRGLTLNDIGNAVVIGIVFSVAFLFVFPGRSISTLMHDVFQLPGPGAGIGLILGPCAIMAGLFVYAFNPRPGTALFTVLTFGLVVPIGEQIFHPEGLGEFPFYLPLASFVILAALLDVLAYLFAKRDLFQRLAPPAVLSNIVFLVFWWLTVFPLYQDRWPVKAGVEVNGISPFFYYISPILIIVGVSMVGAVAIGALVPMAVLHLRDSNTKDTSTL